MSQINGLEVKREITSKRLKGDAQLAMLSGFTRACLSLTKRGGRGLELCLDCPVDFVRDYVSGAMMEQFKVTSIERDDETAEPYNVKPIDRGDALVYGDCEKLLGKLHILKPDSDVFELDTVPSRFSDSAAYYVRGVFLGCGSLSVPTGDDAKTRRSGGYHLEFSFTGEELAEDFIGFLDRVGISARRTVRAERHVVYVKDSESVSDCLVLMGAEKAALKLNQAVVTFSVKLDVNRRNNCDVANMSRTVDAFVYVARAIEKIENTIGLDALDKKLRDVAEARKRLPDAPLSVIADELCLSKSGLKHRLDKIVSIAAELSGDNSGDKPSQSGTRDATEII